MGSVTGRGATGTGGGSGPAVVAPSERRSHEHLSVETFAVQHAVTHQCSAIGPVLQDRGHRVDGTGAAEAASG